MSVRRLRINQAAIRSLTRTAATARVVQDGAESMKARVEARGVEARTDGALGEHRYRSAVIAGYQDGATPESTREALLSALDGGEDA